MNFPDNLKTIASAIGDYFGRRGNKRIHAIADSKSLEDFINTRASHVAQTSLYGYIRTRAGSRFPELFENDEFIVAINIAKWQMWLACVSDLSVFAGGLISRRTEASGDAIGDLVTGAVRQVLDQTGVPEEAGEAFSEGRKTVLARLDDVDWTAVGDDESAFTASPAALKYWAPIVDELKELDDEIVRNSVRFRWQEVRRDLRDALQAESLFRPAEDSEGAQSPDDAR